MRSGRTAKLEEFEEIVHRFEIPLLQYARRITGDREQARDVVQETFVKFERNGALRSEDKPATWLFTVCRHTALNVCRKEKRMMYVDEEVIEAREASNPCLLTSSTKGSGRVPAADCRHPAAAAAGSDSTQIPKRAQLPTDRRDHADNRQ